MTSKSPIRTFLYKLIPVYCGFILASILLFPPIKLGPSLPAIELVDFLLPFTGLIVLLNWSEIIYKKTALLLFVFSVFIFLSMAINHRLGHVSDHFEIYKLVKFGLLIFLFSLIKPERFLQYWIKPLFISLVFFNLAHYFNLFNFNLFLENFYFGNRNYIEFGLNSAGIPVSKRMLGFMSNPNSNAVMFSVFAIIFIPKKDTNWKGFLLFTLAVLMVFLCQSRTALFSFIAIILTYGVLNYKAYKRLIMLALFSAASILSANLISTLSVGVGTPINMEMVRAFEKKHPNLQWDDERQIFLNSNIAGGIANVDEYTYLESLTHGEFMEGSSMMGRYDVWMHLWKMIRQKPLFGHGPYKEYFYENMLYAENEFIFMTWRYGFIGLFIFLSVCLALLILAIRYRKLDWGSNTLMILVLYAITGMTNLPFSAITLNMILGISIGIFFAEIKQKSQKDSLRI